MIGIYLLLHIITLPLTFSHFIANIKHLGLLSPLTKSI